MVPIKPRFKKRGKLPSNRKHLGIPFFFDFIDCSSNSKTAELIWQSHYRLDLGEEPGKGEPNITKKANIDTILCHLKNRKQILDLIGSFPPFEKHFGGIEMIKAGGGYDELTFICDQDTLLEFHWGEVYKVGKWHIWINENYYDINIAELKEFLDSNKNCK